MLLLGRKRNLLSTLPAARRRRGISEGENAYFAQFRTRVLTRTEEARKQGKLQFGCQTTPAEIILKKRCVLELRRLSRPPFKSDASSNLEALNVHYENLLSFQSLRNYNHGNNNDAG